MRMYTFAALLLDGFSFKSAWIISKRETIWDVTLYVLLSVLAVYLSVSTAIARVADIKKEIAAEAIVAPTIQIDRLEKIVVSCLNGKPVVVDGIAAECSIKSLGIRL